MEGKLQELRSITLTDKKFLLAPSRAYDEILPSLYLGDGETAKNKHLLGELGITHVLNCAQGTKFFHVNTSAEFYQDANIKLEGLHCSDTERQDISQHFETAANYIEDALKESGRIMVHCVEGFSRSPTIVISYLMLKHKMTVQEALRLVRSKREVRPNDGFLHQLVRLDEKLQN